MKGPLWWKLSTITVIITLIDVIVITEVRYIPISGILSEDSGSFSAMAKTNTEKASKTVMPRAIFSPESGGRKNTKSVRIDILLS